MYNREPAGIACIYIIYIVIFEQGFNSAHPWPLSLATCIYICSYYIGKRVKGKIYIGTRLINKI